MENLHLCENYRVNARAEAGCALGVIAFGGIGQGLGGIQADEFLSTTQGRASTVFVNDLRRSWWNNGRVEDVIGLAIDYLKRNDCRKIFAIGNSMGGSGAILSGHLFEEIGKVFAFVPQAVPYADPRWRPYTSQIGPIRWENFAAMPLRCEHLMFFGADIDRNADFPEIEQFRKHGRNIKCFEQCEHNVAKFLKTHDLYQVIIDVFLSDRAEKTPT